MKTVQHRERTYRRLMRRLDLVSFEVRVEETDLHVQATRDLSDLTRTHVERYREDIKAYARRHAYFLAALSPIEVSADAPAIVRRMADDARAFDVGPMAAVAGAIADFVSVELANHSEEVIIENGGDIFVKSHRPVRFTVYAGDESPFTNKLVFELADTAAGKGLCTSSGTVGHSLSFGNSDATVVAAHSAGFADAAATALGNALKQPDDIGHIIAGERKAGRLDAVVLMIGEHVGFWGKISLVEQ